MKTVLTIAGYDPSSGAGVTADLMVFRAHGLFGTSCITTLTVQSTFGVQSTHPVDPNVVRETLRWLDEDIRPCGVKIGLVASSLNIAEIVSYINHLHALLPQKDTATYIPVVLDPVALSSSGLNLIDIGSFAVLREQLMPVVDWITPNLHELTLLTGKAVETRDDLPAACHFLQQATATKGDPHTIGILAKGGHLDQPDDYLLTPEGEGHWLAGERVETQATHGTGCALSSAFLCQLVLGKTPLEAATGAKKYVTEALRNAPQIGNGRGPINHLWNISKV